MESSKNAVGPIVASVLLVLVVVVTIVLVNSWYITYQSELGASVEKKNNKDLVSVKVLDSLSGSDLYLNNQVKGEPLQIIGISIDGVNCLGVSGNYSEKYIKIDLKSCLKKTSKLIPIIKVKTSSNLYSKLVYLDSSSLLGTLGPDGKIIEMCELSGVNVPLGQNYSFFNSRASTFNSPCASQIRTCLNTSSFDGDPSYKYATCYIPNQDSTPNILSFSNLVNVSLLTEFISNEVTISGFDGIVPFNVSSDKKFNGNFIDGVHYYNKSYISVNNGSFTISGLVSPGDKIRLKIMSSGFGLTKRTSYYNFGNLQGIWTVETGVQDKTPNPFAFINQTGTPVLTYIISENNTITGFDGFLAVNITGDGNPQVSVNGGNFSNYMFISPNQNLSIKMETKSSGLSQSFANISIGNFSLIWKLETN